MREAGNVLDASLLQKIELSVVKVHRRAESGLAADRFAEPVAVENTRHQVERIRARRVILKDPVDAGRFGLAAGMYSVASGEGERGGGVRVFPRRRGVR